MRRLILLSSATALAIAGGPVLAQSMIQPEQIRVTMDDGTIDTIDRQPRYNSDYVARTPRGNLIAYDVDGDGWVTYDMNGESYVARDADGDGYVLRTDVPTSANVDVITVTYDPSDLRSLPGDYDAAYLIDRTTAQRIFVREASVTEGGRHTALGDRNDLIVAGRTGQNYVVQNAARHALAASDVTEVWAADRDMMRDRRIQLDRDARQYADMQHRDMQHREMQRRDMIRPASGTGFRMFQSPVHQVFSAIDANSDNLVTRAEWASWQSGNTRYAARFDEFDQNRDGELTWTEYQTSVAGLYGTRSFVGS